jgi:hypothetical protein
VPTFKPALEVTLKRLGLVVGLMTALAVGPPAMVLQAVAWAQGAARDQSGAVSVAPDGSPKSWLAERFAGSYAELSSFVGTGTFYASGYSNPYVSNALYLKPIYHLGTKRDLTLNARLYIEAEYTQPDNAQARRFYPLDPWIWLAARNLYTEARSKIRFGGTARLVVPGSYESLYAHLLVGVAVGGSAARDFQFGRPDAKGKRWGLSLSFGEVFTKNLHSSVIRGNGPGDATGCRAAPSQPAEPAGDSPSASSSDHCGGPLNTSFTFMTSGSAALTRGRWSAAATLILINQFRYEAPPGAFSSTNVPVGREDLTWGILALGYELRAHLGVAAGVSSYQPALDSRYRYPRFPFFDFSGTNLNNYTQLFVNVNGTL